jgi:aromatic-L-amino-acid decarboxylase
MTAHTYANLGEASTAMSKSLIDPDNWGATRQLAHRAVDEMFEYLETVAERPAWRPMPEEVKRAIDEVVPYTPLPVDTVYQQFANYIRPFPTGNIHPRFWGWIMGTGSPVAMIADMLASGMNAHVAGFDQSAVEVERVVLKWLKEILGMPAESSGLLVSGGTMTNLVGLTVSRFAGAGYNVRAKGIAGRK